MVSQIVHLQMQLAPLALDVQIFNRHVGLFCRLSLLKPETRHLHREHCIPPGPHGASHPQNSRKSLLFHPWQTNPIPGGVVWVEDGSETGGRKVRLADSNKAGVNSPPMKWTDLVQDHGAALVLYARQWCVSHADAEDAVQEGFVRVWKSGEVDAMDEQHLLGYLFAAVRTAALDRLRKNKRRKRREEKAADEAGEELPLFEHDRQSEDRIARLQAALETLPAEQREILVMKIWGELTFKSIARNLSISPNTAASRYRYGLAALRDFLGTEDHL